MLTMKLMLTCRCCFGCFADDAGTGREGMYCCMRWITKIELIMMMSRSVCSAHYRIEGNLKLLANGKTNCIWRIEGLACSYMDTI